MLWGVFFIGLHCENNWKSIYKEPIHPPLHLRVFAWPNRPLSRALKWATTSASSPFTERCLSANASSPASLFPGARLSYSIKALKKKCARDWEEMVKGALEIKGCGEGNGDHIGGIRKAKASDVTGETVKSISKGNINSVAKWVSQMAAAKLEPAE